MLKYTLKVSLIVFILSVGACSQDQNVYDCEDGRKEVTCSEQTTSEEAMAHLKASEFAEAIADYKTLIAEEPESWTYYRLLAASYAGHAGFDFWGADLEAVGGSVEDFAGALMTFYHDDTCATSTSCSSAMESMNSAILELEKITEDTTCGEGGEEEADSSDESEAISLCQMTLYRSGYTALQLTNLRLVGSGDFAGEYFDASDAAALMDNLDAIIADTVDEKTKAKVVAIHAEINAQGGATDKEKLKEYMASQEGER